jgi:tetratricopeptide (TPR) repeat protein
MWFLAALLAAFFVPPDNTADGMKALEEQRYEAAIQSFGKVLESDPKDYAAQFHIALAQSLLNRDADAIASYKKVLELKPGLYEAQLNLGIVLLNSGAAKEAATYLEEAANKNRKNTVPCTTQQKPYSRPGLLSSRFLASAPRLSSIRMQKARS